MYFCVLGPRIDDVNPLFVRSLFVLKETAILKGSQVRDFDLMDSRDFFTPSNPIWVAIWGLK